MSLNGPVKPHSTFTDLQQEQLIVQDPYTTSTVIARRAERGLQAFIYHRNIAADRAYQKLKQKEYKNAIQRRK
jgi:hypothetical protein